MYSNILAAIDHGPCMTSVSTHAIKQAVAFDAKLTLCHIKKNTVLYKSMLPGKKSASESIVQDHSYAMDEALERIKKGALKMGVKEVEIVQTYSASPGIALADIIVPGYEVDLIVTGRSNKSSLSRLLLGSVSSNIMHYATCDVLLVKAKAH